MDDYRSPDYAGRLVARVQTLGIADACHFLGLIPKLDQIALMREAIAVIQPTLFEGGPGGGAVYAAIGLGQPVIVSDISVNREIAECIDEYFAPDDPKALLACMCRVKDKARQSGIEPRCCERGVTAVAIVEQFFDQHSPLQSSVPSDLDYQFLLSDIE